MIISWFLLGLCLSGLSQATITSTDITGSYTSALSLWNAERAFFGLPPLTWSTTAQAQAASLAKQCSSSLTYSGISGYLLVLYTCSGSASLSTLSSIPPTYKCSSPIETCPDLYTCLPYRQIIAKDATTIGCSISSCSYSGELNACSSSSTNSFLICITNAAPTALPTPAAGKCKGGSSPTPISTPKVTPSPSPISTPKATPSPISTPKATPSPISTPKATPKPTPSPISTPKPTPSPISTPKATPSPISTPKPTPSPISTPKATPSPISTPKATPSPISTPKATPSPISTPKATPSPTPVSTPPPGGCVVPAGMTATLAAHQTERAKFGIAPLVWDCKLAQVAQNYANSCPGLVHSTNAGAAYGTGEYVGENLALAGGKDPDTSGWVGEKSSWTCSSNTCSGVCGHYTQMIWAQTTRVGCGLTRGCAGTYPNILVCNYAVGGNFNGLSPLDYGNGTKLKCPVSYAIADSNAVIAGGAMGVSLSVGSFVGIIIGTVFFSMLFTFIIIILVSKFKRSQEEIH